jgi:hypothetical protein
MRAVRGATALLVGVAVLTGCSDGATANETLPPISSSPAETTESLPPLGPPDLPMPAEAREQTPAGAEAFIRYYMDVYNWAQAHMNVTYMRQLSRDCDTCARIMGEIENDAATGYSYRGGQVTVDYVDATDHQTAAVEAVFSISQAQLAVLDNTGQPLPGLSFDAHKSPGCGAVLAWDGRAHTWILEQWDIN